MIAYLIIDCWNNHPDVAGILATVLSKKFYLWNPNNMIIEKLKKLCKIDLVECNHTRIGLLEPLVNVLTAKGIPDIHRSFLSSVIEIESWREADIQRIENYYGTIDAIGGHIKRHLDDPHIAGNGLLCGNDVARLMYLITTWTTGKQFKSRRQKILLHLLQKSINILSVDGEIELAKKVIKQMRCYEIDLQL